MSNKFAYFHSTNHPCTENAMNVNMLKRWYLANGWAVTQDPKDADCIIVSTCGFSKSEESKELADIRSYSELKKDECEIILTGCLALIAKDKLNDVFTGKNVRIQNMSEFNEIMNFSKKIEEFDNHYISEEEYNTDPLIHRLFKARKLFEKLSFIPGIKVPRTLLTVPSEKWFLIRGSMGCTGKCTYCAIKHAHGALVSEPADKIIEQVKKGGLARL